ncbi:Gustatory receptor 22 [Hyalella azteca]|uniref:Gustatory receptor 22 n=1 Tax=Hyalella azteca TaxID=294128 RepID=A0A6A0HEH8_HYAAZ|nr:Gustatory receptor 22 [Hyalella azteca]
MKDWTRVQWRISLINVIVFWLKMLRASGCFPYAIDVIDSHDGRQVHHDKLSQEKNLFWTCNQMNDRTGDRISMIKLTPFKRRWLNALLLFTLASSNILASFAELKLHHDLFAVHMTGTEIATVAIVLILRNLVFLSILLYSWRNSGMLQNLVQITVDILHNDHNLMCLRSSGYITLFLIPLLFVQLVIMAYTQFGIGRDVLGEQLSKSYFPIVWSMNFLYLINFIVYFSLVCLNNACQSVIVYSFERLSRSLEFKVDFYVRKRCKLEPKFSDANDQNPSSVTSSSAHKKIQKFIDDNRDKLLEPGLVYPYVDGEENLLEKQKLSAGAQLSIALKDDCSITDIMRMQKLSMMQDKINSFFWFSTLIYSAAFVTFSAGVGFIYAIAGLTMNHCWSYILFFIIQAMPVGLLYHTSDQLNENKNLLVRELARFQLFTDEPTEAEQARRLIEFVRVQPGATAGNFFSLSKAKLLAMMGFISSYLVILLQFNGKTKFLLDRLAGLNQSAMQDE